ncbi:peptidase M23 [Bacillus altitudinis]|uniref:peptidase M23 n=1 Tax=Bacillus altitudinis TaxID=293387 RepID=UPI001C225280|nr:peptidase M23 [Bacillus altitudinis]MBU8855202.1 peptidase M23 [Bacillus sp. FJAT-26377]MCY7454247.1 peptidase M23 [Bacillus altitudinis]
MIHTIRSLILLAYCALVINIQFNLEADKTTNRQIKNAADIAVHDASIALNRSELADGKVVFDPKKAEEYFNSSLSKNLNLKGSSSNFQPVKSSFYKTAVKLEKLVFIDDNTVGISFPFVYKDPDFNIREELHGPSVLAVITTDSPRYFAGDSTKITRAAVYEYKK